MPLVSIIVPCFNAEKHIEKTIHSLVVQTYEKLEIILVDDASDVNLALPIGSDLNQDPRIKIIRHKKNLGLSSARNTGLKNAKGEYILFWDADDSLAANTIEVLLKNAIDNSSQLVRGVLARTNGSQRWITKRGRNLLKNLPQTNFRQSHELAMDFTSCGILFSRDFLENKKIQFEPRLYMQDILFMSEVLLKSQNICMTDHIVGDYLQSSQSASKLRNDKRFESLFELHGKLEALFEENNTPRDLKDVILAGFINSALNTFLLWKLEDYEKHTADLNRLSALLEHLGEVAINQYCMDMLDEPSYLRLHATRLKNYNIAASVSSNAKIYKTDLKALDSENADQDVTIYMEFLDRLRNAREISKTNSRLILRDGSDVLLLPKLSLEKIKLWMKSKLSYK